MLALTLGQAKTIGIVVVLVLAAGAVAAAWIMKTIMQKAAMAIILGLVAVLVWSQRASLDDCADRVKEDARSGDLQVDTTCSFLGNDIQIKTPNRQ